MQKQNNGVRALLYLGLIAISATAYSQIPSAQDSIITVDELIKIDNANARDKAKRDSIASGITAEPNQGTGSNFKPLEAPRATLTVQQIAGVGKTVKADVKYNGQSYQGVREGEALGKCNIAEIKGTCVALKPVTHIAGKAVKIKADQCPSACWTGTETQVITEAGGRPLPPDMPTLGRPVVAQPPVR